VTTNYTSNVHQVGVKSKNILFFYFGVIWFNLHQPTLINMKKPPKKQGKAQKSLYMSLSNWEKVEEKAKKQKRSTNFILEELVENNLKY